jgi:hypothetical protein
MPIHCPINVPALSADEFEKLDYRVMGHAYASQNELGRLCDECAYEADLKARLLADGFRSVQTQVPVTVTHGDFSKTYRLDLVPGDALYELKAETTRRATAHLHVPAGNPARQTAQLPSSESSGKNYCHRPDAGRSVVILPKSLNAGQS